MSRRHNADSRSFSIAATVSTVTVLTPGATATTAHPHYSGGTGSTAAIGRPCIKACTTAAMDCAPRGAGNCRQLRYERSPRSFTSNRIRMPEKTQERRSMLFLTLGALLGLAIAGYGLFTAKGIGSRSVPPQDLALVNERPIL